ncbi:MAG: trypsin-like peptidase domain-containing protein [Chloroflexota bacterium]
MGQTQTRVSDLEDEVGTLSTQISRTTLNASQVYQKVAQSVVRVTDGQHTIGSGFIFDDRGHVVTASHVAEHLSQIEVILPDGYIAAATLTGNSPQSDVAVLKLTGRLTAPPLTLADSATLVVGEPVVAMGSPLNLPDTLTTGSISQLDRYVEIQLDTQTRWTPNLIQFDAAVNPGNSGGPLFNTKGEVIGLVIARINPQEGDGINYAVSANKVKRVAAAIIDHGVFAYPWLGLEVSDLTPDTALALGRETVYGALVRGISPGGPATSAGIQRDDIVVSFNGTAIRNVAHLISYLGEHSLPGDQVKIGLIRDGQALERSLIVGQR